MNERSVLCVNEETITVIYCRKQVQLMKSIQLQVSTASRTFSWTVDCAVFVDCLVSPRNTLSLTGLILAYITSNTETLQPATELHSELRPPRASFVKERSCRNALDCSRKK